MLKLTSPAKINLFLRILGKRPDGYHELASLFQAIDLADTLHFSLSDADHLTCTEPAIPTDGSNLVWKAVNLFRRKTSLKFNLKVHLEKKIPHEAGLGGGSSNAATTLWALNELLNRPASLKNLIAWSNEIGSDVPFFLSRGVAYCTGRGEILQPLTPFQRVNLWIVKPSQGLSTPAVYGSLKLATLPPRNPQECLQGFLTGFPEYFNDLEEAAFSVMPELALLKKQLLDLGFNIVLLSGSGSSFFCMGRVPSAPVISGCVSYPAGFIYRSDNQWYKSK